MQIVLCCERIKTGHTKQGLISCVLVAILQAYPPAPVVQIIVWSCWLQAPLSLAHLYGLKNVISMELSETVSEQQRQMWQLCTGLLKFSNGCRYEVAARCTIFPTSAAGRTQLRYNGQPDQRYEARICSAVSGIQFWYLLRVLYSVQAFLSRQMQMIWASFSVKRFVRQVLGKHGFKCLVIKKEEDDWEEALKYAYEIHNRGLSCS